MSLGNKKNLIIAGGVTLLILSLGSALLLSYWKYFEAGQDILLGLFFVVTVLLFLALQQMQFARVFFLLILIGGIVFYATKKYEWRKNYIQQAEAGNFFVLEEYIDSYPTLEEYKFKWFGDKPRWVDFADECVEPVLKDELPAAHCRSTETIKFTYNLNPKKLVENHYKKMQRTALRIEGGKLKSKRQYQACLRNKTCAKIPLLPANVVVKDIEDDPDAHNDVRRMFWSLINENAISPEICEYMELCRAMREVGIMPIVKPTLKTDKN